MRNIRIKTHLVVFLNKNNYTLHFLSNPYKSAIFRKPDIAFQLLKYLNGQYSTEEMIATAAKELSLDENEIKRKTEELLQKGLLEYFAPDQEKDALYERYSRQLNFFDALKPSHNREEALKAQDKLRKSHVLILGVGGIGSFACYALAGAGVGTLTLFDGDVIELSNLNRQILYNENTIGKKKVNIAKRTLEKFNSDIRYNLIHHNLTNHGELEEKIKEFNIEKIDIILLSADYPLGIRSWIEEYGKKFSVPYISCGYSGHFGMVGPLVKHYEDRSEINPNDSLERVTISTPPSMGCSNGILSNIACLEIIKYLTNITQPVTLDKRMIINLNDFSIKYN